MDKRQKYSVKGKVSSSSAPSGNLSAIEPQCSYMFGGLGDLRRQVYLLKSPLKENIPAATSCQNRRESAEPKPVPQKYCNAATVAANVRAESASSTGCGAVKINPLLMHCSEDGGSGGVADAVFHGQMSKIRRTKEREMMCAMMEVASSQGKTPIFQ